MLEEYSQKSNKAPLKMCVVSEQRYDLHWIEWVWALIFALMNIKRDTLSERYGLKERITHSERSDRATHNNRKRTTVPKNLFAKNISRITTVSWQCIHIASGDSDSKLTAFPFSIILKAWIWTVLSRTEFQTDLLEFDNNTTHSMSADRAHNIISVGVQQHIVPTLNIASIFVVVDANNTVQQVTYKYINRRTAFALLHI